MQSLAAIIQLGFILSYVRAQFTGLCSTPKYQWAFFIEDVLENTPVGEEIGHVMIEGNSSEINLAYKENDYFLFDPSTRNVTLKKELDTDQGAPEIPALIIYCNKVIPSNAPTIEITVRIIVTDWNDNPPVFEFEHYTVNISEDALVGTVVITDFKVTDKDQAFSANSRIQYYVAQGQNFSNYFRIDVPTKPTVHLARALDYETNKIMKFVIEAKDQPQGRGDQLTATATVTVSVLDADDQNPQFSEKQYRGVISEDAPPNTIVAVTPRIVARDPDTMNVSVIYKLLDPYEFFAINQTTAEIWNVKGFNIDTPTLSVVVLAAQVDNPNREWFAMLTISITEANINAPSFTRSLYQVTRTELEPVGSILVTTTATDPDFGTVLLYSIVEDVDDLRVDMSGNIILEKFLDYEREQEKTIRVTASDGSHTATTTVHITILDVNDNNPVFSTQPSQFNAERQKAFVITTLSATDADKNNKLSFVLRSNSNIFAITGDGVLSVRAEPSQITLDQYSVLVVVLDDGVPSRESSKLIDVIFPPLSTGGPLPTSVIPTKISTDKPEVTERVAAAVLVETDNMLTIILGAVAGLLLVIILILIVYIVWRNKRTKEELDRARAPKHHAAKGLTYRQAEAPDDLPKQDLGYSDDIEENSDYGATTVQENPLRKAGVNDGYMQSSGSEMDRDISEIEVETAVVPYDDDFGYHSGRPELNGQFRTFRGDDSASTVSSHSDSTGGSQRVLVNGNKDANKMTSWDSDDKIHPQGAQKLLDAQSSTASRTKKERPEITVYF